MSAGRRLIICSNRQSKENLHNVDSRFDQLHFVPTEPNSTTLLWFDRSEAIS